MCGEDVRVRDGGRIRESGMRSWKSLCTRYGEARYADYVVSLAEVRQTPNDGLGRERGC